MSDRVTIEVTVNGRAERLTALAHHSLVDVLREQLRLFGVREGCGVGMCGACTVLLDGKPVSGCLVLAPLADGRDIVTVEGLESDSGVLDPIQESFVEHTAFQCSFCTPGFLLTAKTFLAETTEVTAEGVREHFGGNLCRCGSYSKIEAAIIDAGGRMAAATADH